jgi:hypothetical protein
MKIQRKLLTKEQKAAICKSNTCVDCPLLMRGVNIHGCYSRADRITQDIENFWNEEVEVEV